MIKKLTNIELKELLINRDQRKYISILNCLNNVGNPNLAINNMYGYSINNDLLIVSMLCFNGCELYFEISDFDNIEVFYNEVKNYIDESNEILFSSDSMDIFNNKDFIRIFGKHDVKRVEQYGRFAPIKTYERDGNVRILTIEDENKILSFSEPFQKYRDNLRNAYETYIKTHDENYKMYGYINNEKDILGYLIANTFDGLYWDIAYIYVLENARGKGIAKKLATFYADDIVTAGRFASYGTPENEISKKVAVSSGFDMFESMYLTKWIPNK